MKLWTFVPRSAFPVPRLIRSSHLRLWTRADGKTYSLPAMLDNTGSSKERHRQFVQRVLDSGQVWGLESTEGWAVSGEEGQESMPFWSDRDAAAQCAKEEWSGYEPTAIPLEEFLDNWLPGMAEDGVVVGTNWNADLGGVESQPLALKQELEKEE